MDIIHDNDDINTLISQYEKLYVSFAHIRDVNHTSSNTIIYDLKEEYGEGEIRIYQLLHDVIYSL